MQKQNRKEETDSIHTYDSLRPAIASQLACEAGFQVNLGQTKSTISITRYMLYYCLKPIRNDTILHFAIYQ